MSTAAATAVDTSKPTVTTAGAATTEAPKAAAAPAQTGLLADAAAKAKAAEQPAAATIPGAAKAADPNAKPARPEYLPEQFWDAEKNEPKLEAMSKSWADFRQKSKEGRGEVPEKAEAYTVKFQPGKELPDDDPGWKAIRESALEAGITNKQFEKLIPSFMAKVAPLLPQQVSLADEKAKLHSDPATADAIISGVAQWGDHLVKMGVFGETDYVALIELGSTAEGVAALAKLRSHYTGEKSIPTMAIDGEGLPSKEEWYKQFGEASEKGDAAAVKKLREQGKKLFGEEPAGQSGRGIGIVNPARR